MPEKSIFDFDLRNSWNCHVKCQAAAVVVAFFPLEYNDIQSRMPVSCLLSVFGYRARQQLSDLLLLFKWKFAMSLKFIQCHGMAWLFEYDTFFLPNRHRHDNQMGWVKIVSSNAKPMTPKHNNNPCHAKYSYKKTAESHAVRNTQFAILWTKQTLYLSNHISIYLYDFKIASNVIVNFSNPIGFVLALHLVWHYCINCVFIW